MADGWTVEGGDNEGVGWSMGVLVDCGERAQCEMYLSAPRHGFRQGKSAESLRHWPILSTWSRRCGSQKSGPKQYQTMCVDFCMG